jgi:hypothetical protein
MTKRDRRIKSNRRAWRIARLLKAYAPERIRA